MYKLILKKDKYATVLKDGKEIEPLAGLYVTMSDLAQLDELVRLANAAESAKSAKKAGGDFGYLLSQQVKK